jgi:hypothetical protein
MPRGNLPLTTRHRERGRRPFKAALVGYAARRLGTIRRTGKAAWPQRDSLPLDDATAQAITGAIVPGPVNA